MPKVPERISKLLPRPKLSLKNEAVLLHSLLACGMQAKSLHFLFGVTYTPEEEIILASLHCSPIDVAYDTVEEFLISLRLNRLKILPYLRKPHRQAIEKLGVNMTLPLSRHQAEKLYQLGSALKAGLDETQSQHLPLLPQPIAQEAKAQFFALVYMAARADHADAMNLLGYMGIRENLPESLGDPEEWLCRAAQAGANCATDNLNRLRRHRERMEHAH